MSDHFYVEPKPGDLIEISRLGYPHWAIYVGSGYVITWLLQEADTENITRSLVKMNDEERNHSAFFIRVKNPAERDELKPGDLIEIFRSSCQHWAIYVGDRKVVHLATERDHLAGGAPNTMVVLSNRAYVTKDWLDNVVQKDRFRVNNKHDETHPPLPLAKILWQAEELVGKEMPYAWNNHNCEHFVMELRYGAEMHEQDEIKQGDLIEIFRSCYQHWAIYVGEGKVVHLAPECDRLANGAASVLAVLSDRAYVKKDWLEVVVRKDQFRVNNKHDHTHPPLPLAKILQRAEELVGREMPYNLTSHNCEHFVMELRYGVAMSDQVTEAIAVGTIGMMGVAAAMIRSAAKRRKHRYE